VAKREVTETGTVIYRDDDGKYHREDGPAIEYPSGFKIYYNHGKKVKKEEFEKKEAHRHFWRQVLSWDVSHYAPVLKNVRDLIKVFGLEEIGTGGGCTALSKKWPGENYILITTCEDPTTPTPGARYIGLGFYDHEGYSVIPPFLPGKTVSDKQNSSWRISVKKAYLFLKMWDEYLKSVNYRIPEDVDRV